MKSSSSLSRRELLFGRLLLIYQMPKVGSQTIEASLRQCAYPYPIHRFHYLSRAFAKTLRNGIASTKPDLAWKRDAQRQLDFIHAISRTLRLRRMLCLCGLRIPKLEVATGVRELIGLGLASIFENYLYFAPDLESMTTATCRGALLHPKTFKTLRDWFDLELKPFLGIDVFRTEFPRERGYALYENRFARLLVYRFEILHLLPKLLTQFFHWEIPDLVKTNIGESKEYAQQYSFVKEHLRLPADFVASLYACKMMRHFFSEAERGSWVERWSETPCRAGSADTGAGQAAGLIGAPVEEDGITVRTQ